LRSVSGFRPTNICPELRRAPPVNATTCSTAGSAADDLDEVGELFAHRLERDALVGLDAADQPSVSCCGKKPFGMITYR
jgi:hypothetical protein